jgi:hypothetical protein
MPLYLIFLRWGPDGFDQLPSMQNLADLTTVCHVWYLFVGLLFFSICNRVGLVYTILYTVYCHPLSLLNSFDLLLSSMYIQAGLVIYFQNETFWFGLLSNI